MYLIDFTVYSRQMFPKITDAKIKVAVLVGLQIRHIINNNQV